MSSYVGNKDYIYTYATPINIYCSSLTIYELRKNSKYLPTNSLIISSPQTSYGFDNNKPAIVITDGVGNILPLTYTLNLTSPSAVISLQYNERGNTIDISNNAYFNAYFNI